MDVLVTEGVKIKVENRFMDEYSQPDVAHFVFSYTITIENLNNYEVQLLRRHWIIKDSVAGSSEVEGDGVVGQQPCLKPGESYTYESGCNLKGEMGSMHGTYLFTRIENASLFKVAIPEFKLIAPWVLN
jgi:ApaG protein